MSEATTRLKTLKPAAPDGPTGGTPQELADADPVLVELAHGSVELSQHALTGTILIEHAVEPIVPLWALVDLDAEMSPDAPRPMETVDAC